MAKKAKKPRGSNDPAYPALSGFKALQHVIAATEKPPKKKKAER